MNTQAWMSKRFFSFFLTWGIFLPYWSGWMILTKGVSVAEVSLIMSCGLLIRGISTLFLFPYLAEKVSSKTLLHVAGVGALLAFCFYIPATTFWQLLIVTVLVHIFYPAIMPALESIASILVQNNALKQYGKARQWGSIGFISIGIFITFFTSRYGDELLFWALLMGLAGFVLLSFLTAPAVLSTRPVRDQQEKLSLSRLFRIPFFGITLLIVILIQASHATYYNYGYVFIQTLDVPLYLIG
ncbi:3-phenylpropionic acid transporter [Bacillus sp. JCM 19046]|nr:3-phenylpropionic acid transporter [Bacillus sp. JCM 19045]GAF19672.1 3-phenylpropionic acid transporter [Bacillus sp. JCM 19046]